MPKDTLHLTRKIRLLIDLPDGEEKLELIKKLNRFQNRCFRAANFIVTHLYIQEMIKDFFYLSEGIKYKLADEKKDEMGIFQRSHQNTTYRLVCDKFKGEVPTDVLDSLNNMLRSGFSKTKKDYWEGNCSLKNFRRDIPIPFPPDAMSRINFQKEKGAFCFRLFSIPFKTYLGKDFIDKKILLEQLEKGEVKLCTSQIQLKSGKIYWLAVFEFKKEPNELRADVIAETSLSLENPIVVKVNKERIFIGTKEEFLYRRLAIQASRNRIMKGLGSVNGGRGRNKKLKALDKLNNAEKNFVQNRLHEYSKKLIDFCLDKNAGTLILLNQEEKSEMAKNEEFVLRNWSYYDLITKIKYKAAKAGIELIVD
jgi:IS605 OrfB family transposase